MGLTRCHADKQPQDLFLVPGGAGGRVFGQKPAIVDMGMEDGCSAG